MLFTINEIGLLLLILCGVVLLCAVLLAANFLRKRRDR